MVGMACGTDVHSGLKRGYRYSKGLGGEPHMGVITWGHGVFSGLSVNETDHHSPRSAPMGDLCSFYP